MAEEDVAREQEALLALEMDRLYDAFHGSASDDARRRDAVDHAAAWVLQLWREDRGFLQRTALPLVAFCLFEEAVDEEEQQQDGALEMLLRRVAEVAPTEACKEFFVRHVASEYGVFATVLGVEEASVPALSRVTRRFLGVVARHTLCVETLNDAVERSVKTLAGKKALLQLVDQTERLTPVQKISVLLHVGKVEPVASTREFAVRLLQSFAVHISSVASVIPLLGDKSQKVRRLAASCIIDVGMDCLRDEMDDGEVAQVILALAKCVSGAAQEKRFAAFVGEYFAAASNLDDMCELSIQLDEADAPSHPLMAKIIGQIVGRTLKPSFF